MSEIPFHKSERMFRRYEKHIHNFLVRWPVPTAFDPRPLATTTFSCRLRDAITSVLEYGWTSPVDTARLREVWQEAQVRVVDGMVVVAPKASPKLPEAGAVTDVHTKEDFMFIIDGGPENLVIAAALLLSHRVITKPVLVKNHTEAFLQSVANTVDVGISKTINGFVML